MGTSVSSAYFATALFAISFNEITMEATTMPRTTSVTPMRKVFPEATYLSKIDPTPNVSYVVIPMLNTSLR